MSDLIKLLISPGAEFFEVPKDEISKLKEVLEAEEKVNNNSARVYFNDIDSNGIKMKIYLYTSIVDYDNFLEFKTKMNLLVIETLEKENIRIAYTGENIYLVK